MKPTIKTTDTIAMTYALMPNDETHRPSFEQKEYGELEWLKLDEEIAWLEEQHTLFAELCKVQFPDLPKDEDGFVQFPNGYIESLRKLIANNAKRLEQLRGGEE